MSEDARRIANELVENCRTQSEEKGLDTLYAANAVSVESVCMPGSPSRESVGLDAIRQKHKWWNEAMEVHSGSVDGPYMHGDDRFSVIFEVDATNKQSGERTQMREVAVYHIENGKIVREEFFYGN